MDSFNAEVFEAFQNKLKIGNRRGVHLNAIPGNSRYKFDIARFSTIFQSLPERFILDLLTQRNLNFKFSIHDVSKTANTNFKEEQFPINSFGTKNQIENIVADKEKQLENFAINFDNLIFQNETIKSEKGINTLGFGFPILIRKDMNDGQITAAPILIWSVHIKQSTEMNTWEIHRTEDDPIYLNEVLINHLQSDSGVHLTAISPEMLEDGKIDKPELHAICSDILKQLKADQNIDFLLSNYERILPLKAKSTYDKQLENRGDAFIEKCGIFSLFEVQKQNIINDYEVLKKHFSNQAFVNQTFQSFTSVPTDPSQQNVLESLKHKSKILIQGPPGTGKSQTLTAVLVNALENKQKTVVVCEKQTALEVLYTALNKLGLGKYCILIKDSSLDRRLVVDAVRNTIDNPTFNKNNSFTKNNDLQQTVLELSALKNQITAIHNALNTAILHTFTYNDIVGKVLEYREKTTKLDISNLNITFTNDEFLALKNLFDKGEQLYIQFKPFISNFIYNKKTIIKENELLLQQNVEDKVIQYKSKWKEIEELLANYENYYFNKRKQIFNENFTQTIKLINETEVLTTTLGSGADEFNEEKTNSFLFKFLAFFSLSKKKVLSNQKRLKEITQLLKEVSLKNNFKPIDISDNLWQNKNEIIAYKDKINLTKSSLDEHILNEFKEIDFLNFYDGNISNETSEKISLKINELQDQIKDDAYFKINFGSTLKTFTIFLENILNQYEKDSSTGILLKGYKWYFFYAKLTIFQQKCIDQLYTYSNWHQTFFYAYFYKLLSLKAIEIPTFSENTYNDLKHKIADFGKIQFDYIQNYWDFSQKEAVTKFEKEYTDITVANLYNKRKSTKHNRLPLRQITKKDTDLFTSFFPIVLTTPDVCSNLFEGKNYYFDYVVFDEASQLKLEDNLPALLKGKNVIIAGDEHQMPPSNYFSRVFDGNVEDEDDLENEDVITFKNSILNIESLLDYALEYQFDKNHLDFHYRSKHPYLIDFSNHAFYNARLKPLPNISNSQAIVFYEVGGIFQEHINKEEALKVLEILETIEQKSDGSYPSVGIATFNITQRNFIRRQIIQKQNEKGNEAFKQKISELENAGLFIKNLENIQGDERDIIIISTTYGKKQDGKFLQSFGPINHTKGYKLLNVIITRAKEKIYICNSIPSEYYNSYKLALESEGANNRKAALYAYLTYCKAVSEGNEIKRKEVLDELDKYGSQTNRIAIKSNEVFKNEIYRLLKTGYKNVQITMNAHFGGYTLDILLESSNGKHTAIECLSKEDYNNDLSYLEDIHKEKTLINAGYNYVRLWSHQSWQEHQNILEKVAVFNR